MSFLDTFGQMGVLFILVIIGFVCHKLKIMNDNFDKTLSVLIINVTAPCIILSSVMGPTLPARSEILPVLLLGTLTLAVMLIAGFICTFFLRAGTQAGIYRFMFAFGNINFIGIPVATALFGNYAIFYISVLTIPFNILLFLLGQIFIASCAKAERKEVVEEAVAKGESLEQAEKDADKALKPQDIKDEVVVPSYQKQVKVKVKRGISFNWRMILSPALVSTYIVIALVYFQIQTPKVIGQAFTLAGYMTIPASLMVIGSALANIKILEMLGNVRVYAMSILKLLGIPLAIYGLYHVTPFDHKYTDVLVILAAMPVASYGTMICLKEGIDPKTMAQGTFMSTFLSMFTIPVLALFL